MNDCEVSDILGSGSGCDEALQISYLSGIGVIGLLLLVVVLLFCAVCCLVCKIRRLSRNGLGEITNLKEKASIDGNIAETEVGYSQVQLEEIRSVPAPQISAPDTPDDHAGSIAVEVDDDYDSIENILLTSVKKPQGGEIALPDYDTVSFEKLDIPASDSKATSSSEAPPTKPEVNGQAEYSIVMKKAKPAADKSTTGRSEEYNVLVHDTNSAPQPHQAIVTYASLNKPPKSISEEGGGVQEAPPPPLPPPISENNLLAMKGVADGSINTPGQPGNEKASTQSAINTEKNILYQKCEPGTSITQKDAVSLTPDETKGSSANSEGGGEEQWECLYMNTKVDF